jgi:hypothetical protein
MSARSLSIGLALAAGLVCQAFLQGGDEVASNASAPAAPVEVLARGPVHEAFASLTAEPAPTKPVGKRPPKPLDEQPPEEKPDGNVTWIGGYWAWDDDRNDYLWVSGTWRVPPPGKDWIPGYWREEGDTWQWVPGFWTAAAKTDAPQQVTYLPAPPTTPPQAPPGQAPVAESFWVPGHWVWNGTRYVWTAGYWARVEPGYVWVPAHYSWTPGGYVYVAGYWDLAVKRRGLLYAPVIVRPDVVTVSFSYTPEYAVPQTLVVDSLFVRPDYGHYYFGDYYGPAYREIGFESAYVYSSAHYDSIIVYERYEHRADPVWFSVQVNLFNDRFAGRAPVPPRTIVQNTTVVNNVTNVTNVTNNNTNVSKNITNNTTNVNNNVTNNNTNVSKNVTNNNTTNNNTTNNVTNTNNVTKSSYTGAMVAPAKQVASTQGMTTTPLSTAARQQVKAQSTVTQQAAAQRTRSEVAPPRGSSVQPHTAALPSTKTSASAAASTSHPATNTGSQSQTARPPSSNTTGNGSNAAGSVRPTTAPTMTTPNVTAGSNSTAHPTTTGTATTGTNPATAASNTAHPATGAPPTTARRPQPSHRPSNSKDGRDSPEHH